MQAARFYQAGQPLRIEEIEKPFLSEEEVLLEVKAAGICGTDVHIALEGSIDTATKPITLGHEIAGVVEETGEMVREWKKGDRVVVYPQVFCQKCSFCRKGKENLCRSAEVFGLHRDGGFAQYIKVPTRCLISLPEGLSFEEGAIIPDALSTPHHAITRRGRLKSGETVAIFGCGGLGIQAIKIARILGASTIIGVDIKKGALEHAKKAGADEVIDGSENKTARIIRKITNKRGVDLALEFIGRSETTREAVKSLGMAGRAVVVGMGKGPTSLPSLQIFVGCELSLMGSMGSTREDVQNSMDLVSTGKLDIRSSISDQISLKEINAGLENLHHKTTDPIRIVVNMERE